MTRLQALTLVEGTQNTGESFIIPAEYELFTVISFNQ